MRDGAFIVNIPKTSPALHGPNCVEEYLIPDFANDASYFIGLTTGNRYREAVQGGTYPVRDLIVNDVCVMYRKIRKSNWFFTFEFYERIREMVLKTEGFDPFANPVLALDKSGEIRVVDDLSRRLSKPPRKITAQKKEAFNLLASLCGSAEAVTAMELITSDLKNYDDTDEYGMTLYYVIERLHDAGLCFFVDLDWKEGFDEYETKLKECLQTMHGLVLDVPPTESSILEMTVALPGAFNVFLPAIRERRLEVTFLETGGDEYVSVVHKKENSEAVKLTLKKIGYGARSTEDVEKTKLGSSA